jgi:hypothetical protein
MVDQLFSADGAALDREIFDLASGINAEQITEIERMRQMPDPRVGLAAGLFDAEEAIWNLNLLSTTPPPDDFIGSWGTDLAFKGELRHPG